jgi:SAM-dependent methyltransferase
MDYAYLTPHLRDSLGHLSDGRLRLLDVACGDASFLWAVLGILPNYFEAVGVDSDPESLSEARAFSEDRRVRFVSGDAERLSFYNGSFDLVSVSNALHHIPEPRRALGEMTRVLKPGGYILVNEMIRSDLLPAEASFEAIHHLKAETDARCGIPHRRTYTEGELRGLLEAAGLDGKITTHRSARLVPRDEVEERISFIDAYVDNAAGTEGYAELRRRVELLKPHIRRTGLASQPQMLSFTQRL